MLSHMANATRILFCIMYVFMYKDACNNVITLSANKEIKSVQLDLSVHLIS